MSPKSPSLDAEARRRAINAARAARNAPAEPDTSSMRSPAFDTLPGYRERAMLLDASREHGIEPPTFRTHETRGGPTTIINGCKVMNFGCYDYLGLNGDPRTAEAAIAAIHQYGTSATASRFTAGQKPVHVELEAALARHYGVEAALTFVSGHATNISLISTLTGREDLVIYDAFIHNSAAVGAQLSGASLRSFLHNDLDALETLLRENRGRYRATLVIVEGHYSMDGDVPDLARLVALRQEYGFWLMVDEAHGLGCIGPTGGGVRELYGLSGTDVDIWMGTLSKTLGSTGGYVAGSAALIDILKHEAPGSMYSVALSPPLAAAAHCALQLLEDEPERVAQMHANGQLFLAEARARGLDTGTSVGASVVPVILGNPVLAMAVSEALLETGINVLPVTFPGVPIDAARLRFFISSAHSSDQIRRAVEVTSRVIDEIRAGPIGVIAASMDASRS